jgi:hypothetical protein
VKVFARLEADGAAWRDADFGSGARVASYAGFARPYVEDAETAQFDAVAAGEGALEAFKDSFDGGLGFDAGQSGTLNYLMYDVLLNQWLPPETRTSPVLS